SRRRRDTQQRSEAVGPQENVGAHRAALLPRPPHPSQPSQPVTCLLRSVPGILGQHWIRVQLLLRNRQQHSERCACRLVPPRLRVLAVPDQILAPLGFAGELEPALLEDKVASNGPCERRRDGFFGTGAPVSTLFCGPCRMTFRRRSAASNALYVSARIAKPFQGVGVYWL